LVKHNKNGVLEVVESKRKLHRKVVDIGLNLLGFVHPMINKNFKKYNNYE